MRARIVALRLTIRKLRECQGNYALTLANQCRIQDAISEIREDLLKLCRKFGEKCSACTKCGHPACDGPSTETCCT